MGYRAVGGGGGERGKNNEKMYAITIKKPYSLFSVRFDIEYGFSALHWKQENLASSRNLTHPPELKNRAASHDDSLTDILNSTETFCSEF